MNLTFQHIQLDNGLELIGELNPNARSAALGVFVRTGARDETPSVNGVSHFLEHMIFKGTPRRTALDVNREFDEIGAKYNAFTTEETTVFWGAVLPEYLAHLSDILTDILHPSLRDEDFDTEKQVILEEIEMYKDQPMWEAYDNVMRDHYREHPLGSSILGTNKSVGALSGDQMRGYFKNRYVTNNMLIALTGNADWDAFIQMASDQTRGWSAGNPTRIVTEPPDGKGLRVVPSDKVNQQHTMLISAAPSAESEQRFAADVLATAIGDGTGSRFFWDLVDPGRVESAEFDYHEYNGTGAFMSYFCCDPDLCQTNLDQIRSIFQDVARDGLSPEELQQVKNKAAARIVLRSERPMGRLMPLGYNWLYRREYRTIDDELTTLERIKLDQVRDVIAKYPLEDFTAVSLGPLDQTELH